MFNQVNEGGLNQILTRRLGMQGGASAPGVAPELFPVISLENDRPEWGYLKGERICGRNVTVAAVAGSFSFMQLYLPSTSTEIAVVTSIANTGSSSIGIARGVGIGGGVGGWIAQTVGTRDFRWNGERTSCLLERNSGAALPSLFPAFGLLTTTKLLYQEPIVITPGTSLILFGNALNTAIVAELAWRERPANPGELV